jgi:starch synthase
VVASKVGGIPEAVLDGETGILVPFESMGPPGFEPIDPESFSKDLAAAIDRLLADEPLRIRMGEKGRERVLEHFSWQTIAGQTLRLYEDLLSDKSRKQKTQ